MHFFFRVAIRCRYFSSTHEGAYRGSRIWRERKKNAEMRKEKRFINGVNLKKRTLFFVCGRSFRPQSVSRSSRLLVPPHPLSLPVFRLYSDVKLSPRSAKLFFIFLLPPLPHALLFPRSTFSICFSPLLFLARFSPLFLLHAYRQLFYTKGLLKTRK